MAKTALELLSERNGDSRSALELALDNYEMWFKANQALSLNKDYEISNGQNSKRKLSRADADEIKMMIEFWSEEIANLQGTSIKAPKITPIFTVSSLNA
ncbi:MAG: hypothetical protein DRG78_11140 [Epsilonproteobacteria bacterium]|nr:MAG: hypothetical protein DRG78_11140 [Campylobacterota bacterium]